MSQLSKSNGKFRKGKELVFTSSKNVRSFTLCTTTYVKVWKQRGSKSY